MPCKNQCRNQLVSFQEFCKSLVQHTIVKFKLYKCAVEQIILKLNRVNTHNSSLPGYFAVLHVYLDA